MNVALTGASGFVGRHLARALLADGHHLHLLTRGSADPLLRAHPHAQLVHATLDNVAALSRAFRGCDAVAHCAGISHEAHGATFHQVHVVGTRNVVAAARLAGARRILLFSFLRARPRCGSAYHESKWAAEEIVRASGIDHTILKCGVIYGRGDHMLDHFGRAFHSFPVFAFVGFTDRPIRPVAVEDVVRLARAGLVEGALGRMAVVGPEELTLRQAVRRVAKVAGRQPLMFPLPLWAHYLLGWITERVMTIPLVSMAQVRMLAEGLAEALPPCGLPPADLAPRIPFSEEQITMGLPAPVRLGLDDLRWCRPKACKTTRRVFLEMP